jgi:hypothetical protein
MNRDHAPIDDNQFVRSSSRFVRRIIAIGLLSIAAIVLFVVLIPTMLVMIESGPGAFFYRTAFVQTSPNGRFKLEVRRRMNFPADEIIDPSGTVSVQLIDQETSTLIDEKTFRIHELSELQDPELEWRTNAVAISKIETHHEVTLELKLDRSQ